jgi:hypothetical protein
MGMQVYNAAKVRGEFLAVEKGGHNDVAESAGTTYWKWVSAALHTSG